LRSPHSFPIVFSRDHERRGVTRSFVRVSDVVCSQGDHNRGRLESWARDRSTGGPGQSAETCPRSGWGRFAVEPSADATRELRLDSGELQRETMKLPAVRLFRIGQSRSRPLGSPDELTAVDGPVANNSTRDRVNWLAAQGVPAFFPRPGAGTQLSAGWGRRRLEECSMYHNGGKGIDVLLRAFGYPAHLHDHRWARNR
jgi:hypothetical protein